MQTEIIVALVGAAATIIGVWLQNHFNHMKMKEEHKATIEVIQYQIKELEKKQDKHNNLIERMTAVELTTNYLQEEIKKMEGNNG